MMLQSSRSALSCIAVRASQIPPPTEEKSALAKFSDSIGMPTDEGVAFAFKPFNEVFVGRAAMMGFVSSIVTEFVTGRGTLGQLGIDTPDQNVLIALCVIFGGATTWGAGTTLAALAKKTMSKKEIDRYKSFLNLNKEGEEDWMNESLAMKAKGDSLTAANATSAQKLAKALKPKAPETAMAADATAVEGEAASESAPAPVPTLQARKDMEELMFFNDEMKYARNVEIQNGRAAMMGFLAAILVEAATGNGIIGQCIGYVKASGLLGAKSGF
ncbi:MAG: hypothetical protein WDW38_007743 [Sanguina aurantia]